MCSGQGLQLHLCCKTLQATASENIAVARRNCLLRFGTAFCTVLQADCTDSRLLVSYNADEGQGHDAVSYA